MEHTVYLPMSVMMKDMVLEILSDLVLDVESGQYKQSNYYRIRNTCYSTVPWRGTIRPSQPRVAVFHH